MNLPTWEERAAELEEIKRAMIRDVVSLRTEVARYRALLRRCEAALLEHPSYMNADLRSDIRAALANDPPEPK